MRALAGLLLLMPAVAAAAGYGVPQSGYPSWEERTVAVYVNRARADPAADLAGCASTSCLEWACYAPSAPMVWDYNLNRSARFHASNLGKTGSALQHDSPCVLVSNVADLYPPNGSCDGSASCACQPNTLFNCAPSSQPNGTQPTCTSPWERIGLFGGSGQAENAAGGASDPKSVFYLWLWESDGSSACGWRYTNGHRANILGSASSLGVGHDQGFWTQDFGSGAPAQALVSGSHEPQQGAGSVEFRANWYASAAPSDAEVDVDGACTPMAVERGSAGNASYLATLPLDGSCHRYLFMFKDASGNTVLLPESGSYGVGAPSTCPDWQAAAPLLCGGGTGSTTGAATSSSGSTTGTTATTGGGATTSGATSSTASSTSGTGSSSTASSSGGSTASSSSGGFSGAASTSGSGGRPVAAPGSSAVSGSCATVPGWQLGGWLALALLGLRRRVSSRCSAAAPRS